MREIWNARDDGIWSIASARLAVACSRRDALQCEIESLHIARIGLGVLSHRAALHFRRQCLPVFLTDL